MWQRGHQVILSYEEDMEVEKHCELWPAIPYWWGNKTATRALIQYLERMKRMGRPGRHRESLGGNKGHAQQCKTSRNLGHRSVTRYSHLVCAVCMRRAPVAECSAQPWVSAAFVFGGASAHVAIRTCTDYIDSVRCFTCHAHVMGRRLLPQSRACCFSADDEGNARC